MARVGGIDDRGVHTHSGGRGRSHSKMTRAATASPLILVVDDIVDNRQMYAEYLEYKGYRVTQAGSGLEAVMLAQSARPALIVMDLSMPGMDGWEATRRLKADPRTATIRILVVTGHALDTAERRALDAGADAFVIKPCLPDDLAAKVAAMLQAA
jgi:two-component system cell cycle response regulator DivK